MAVKLDLTDEQAEALAEELMNIEPYYGTPLREVLDILKPPEEPDPRGLPPGERLNRIACLAMHPEITEYHGSHACHAYSLDRAYVGAMLDWLHEQGHGITLDCFLETGKACLAVSGVKSIRGETPQHALAIAVAIVGQSHG